MWPRTLMDGESLSGSESDVLHEALEKLFVGVHPLAKLGGSPRGETKTALAPEPFESDPEAWSKGCGSGLLMDPDPEVRANEWLSGGISAL